MARLRPRWSFGLWVEVVVRLSASVWIVVVDCIVVVVVEKAWRLWCCERWRVLRNGLVASLRFGAVVVVVVDSVEDWGLVLVFLTARRCIGRCYCEGC